MQTLFQTTEEKLNWQHCLNLDMSRSVYGDPNKVAYTESNQVCNMTDSIKAIAFCCKKVSSFIDYRQTVKTCNA
jgi:hypothetical protein